MPGGARGTGTGTPGKAGRQGPGKASCGGGASSSIAVAAGGRATRSRAAAAALAEANEAAAAAAMTELTPRLMSSARRRKRGGALHRKRGASSTASARRASASAGCGGEDGDGTPQQPGGSTSCGGATPRVSTAAALPPLARLCRLRLSMPEWSYSKTPAELRASFQALAPLMQVSACPPPVIAVPHTPPCWWGSACLGGPGPRRVPRACVCKRKGRAVVQPFMVLRAPTPTVNTNQSMPSIHTQDRCEELELSRWVLIKDTFGSLEVRSVGRCGVQEGRYILGRVLVGAI